MCRFTCRNVKSAISCKISKKNTAKREKEEKAVIPAEIIPTKKQKAKKAVISTEIIPAKVTEIRKSCKN